MTITNHRPTLITAGKYPFPGNVRLYPRVISVLHSTLWETDHQRLAANHTQLQHLLTSPPSPSQLYYTGVENILTLSYR